MSFSLIPDLLLTDYGDLTPQMLTERGICLLLCDLDYTLAPKYVPRDPRLSNVWGKEIYRITLKTEEKKATGKYEFVIQQVK